MRPVKQTVLFGSDGIGNGNCFAACLASLLELPLWMVPPFEQMFGRDDWRVRVDEWLARFFKLKLMRASGNTPHSELPEFYIANGRSARGVYHSTIYRAGVIAHDPHYSNDGIQAIEWCWFLAPIS